MIAYNSGKIVGEHIRNSNSRSHVDTQKQSGRQQENAGKSAAGILPGCPFRVVYHHDFQLIYNHWKYLIKL